MATCFAPRSPKTTLYREFLTLDNPCSHFQQPPPPLLTASHESLDQTFFYSEEPSQLGRISAGAVEES
jgi:hypothetical protein